MHDGKSKVACQPGAAVRRGGLDGRQLDVDNGLKRWLMNARSSRFFIAGRIEEPVFVLDGVASEWLFVSKFWKKTNALLGTMFGQFEEDEAEPATLGRIARELDDEICELEGREDETISFVYRWTPHGEVDVLETPRATLISQLAAARDFLFSAAENGELVELSL